MTLSNDQKIDQSKDEIKIYELALNRLIEELKVDEDSKSILRQALLAYKDSVQKYFALYLANIAKLNAAVLQTTKASLEDLSIDIKYLEFDREALLNEKKELIEQVRKLGG